MVIIKKILWREMESEECDHCEKTKGFYWCESLGFRLCKKCFNIFSEDAKEELRERVYYENLENNFNSD